jgi:hypothetical protein
MRDLNQRNSRTAQCCVPQLFLSTGQDRFEMRRLLLSSHNADFNPFEPGLFQPAMEIAFGKAQPAVAIELMSSLKLMPCQIQNYYLAAWFEQAISADDRAGGIFGVVQCLAENH